MFPAKPNDFTHSLQTPKPWKTGTPKASDTAFSAFPGLKAWCACNTQRGKEDVEHTWFLKERCRTGSSAAREMLLSKMKNRIRLVKMLSLTIRWQWTRNLQERGEAQLYLSKNSNTWEAFSPSTRGLPCKASSLCPSTGRTWLSAQDSRSVCLNGEQSLPPDRAFCDFHVVWNLPAQNYTPCFHLWSHSWFM